MKPLTKQRKQDEKLAELLGISIEEVQAKRGIQEKDNHIREAQSVLLFIEKPDAFIEKKCDNCRNKFMTTYQFVSVCSTQCRVKSLEKIGIDWNPLHTADERWKRAEIPIEYSIPPKALAILLELAKSQVPEPPAETSNTVEQYNGAQVDLVTASLESFEDELKDLDDLDLF